MEVNFITDNGRVRFEAEPDSTVSYYQDSLKTEIFLGRVQISVVIKIGPVPDLSGYKPFERHGLNGFCKSREDKDFTCYEEIDPIGEQEQKILLSFTISDYSTRESRTKSLGELLGFMPVVQFLASIKIFSHE